MLRELSVYCVLERLTIAGHQYGRRCHDLGRKNGGFSGVRAGHTAYVIMPVVVFLGGKAGRCTECLSEFWAFRQDLRATPVLCRGPISLITIYLIFVR